ncbi:release factor glutamine methyltransferase [Deinococcus yavapaiensis KR-236]|uniref:peptide chain release factor N(5)-glutamine methyltransferase n=2 Tax=Deinococcus TaxID=1298 RepID=A0A318SE46_9DEIO|nr:release factor glutamine methyltransferase [Deinococcus yavapaiensis KR-236]
MHALGWSRADLVTRRDLDVPLEILEPLARRREAREPLQHLLGEVEWGELTLKVSPAALIPRPETEVLLELVLQCLRGVAAPRVLDVGTGTGVLALGVKAARPDAVVLATDVSEDALELARENAARLELDVEFVLGDLTANLAGPFNAVVSNPPYLPDADAARAQPEVRHDPSLALYGGPDGLALARRLVLEAERLTTRLALELDPRNVRVLASEMTGWTVTVHPDLTGRDRFLLASK